jgi:uncharacterized lipoprotein YmbA
MKPYPGTWLPLLVGVAACSSGPPQRTYVLTPPLDSAVIASTPAVPTARERIVMRRVLVPDYLDTTDILLRDGSNEVKVSATGHWGERLSQGLTRALAADLVARLPYEAVVLDGSNTAHRQLLISVNALDLWPDGRCALAASWTLVDRDAPRAVVASGSGTFDWSPPIGSSIGIGDARLVDAMARTADKLADAIALSIREVSERPGPRAD